MSIPERAIVQFLTHHFPWWGNCHFRFMPHSKTLYIYSHDPSKRQRILSELESLSDYDIGVAQLILIQPPHPMKVVHRNKPSHQAKPIDMENFREFKLKSGSFSRQPNSRELN